MSPRYWLIVIFLAFDWEICHGRPQAVANPSPVYRPSRDLQGSESRYEKKPTSKSYVRIDFKRNTTRPTSPSSKRDQLVSQFLETAIPTLADDDMSYVPISVSRKNASFTKKWPGDANGIESLDDLSLYNQYTGGISQPQYQYTGGINHPPYQSRPPHKPSIIIIEELTTRPFYDYSRPPNGPNVIYSPPINIQPSYEQRPSTTTRPYGNYESPYPAVPYPINTERPHYSSAPQPITTPSSYYTLNIPQPTKKPAACPNVMVTATNTIVNNNNHIKQDCSDINVNINTNLDNANIVRPSATTTRPQDDDTSSSSPGTPIVLAIGQAVAIIRRVIRVLFTLPMTMIIAGGIGIGAIFFPWAFLPIFLARNRGRNRFIILRNRMDKPQKYKYESLNESAHYLKSADAAKDNISSTTGRRPKPEIEDIATVARASNDGPILTPAVAAVADQLFDNKATEMVDSDIRTPPKLKEIIKEKKGEDSDVIVDKIEANGKFEVDDGAQSPLAGDSSEGKASHSKKKEEEGTKGIAVPVIMDEAELEPVQPNKKLQKIPDVQKPAKDEKKKKTPAGKPQKDSVSTTPSSGLSTWILLSDNREATTPTTNKKSGGASEKKNTTPTTTKKPNNKAQLVTASPTTSKPPAKLATAIKASANSKKPDNDGVALTALETMVKNQKKAQATTTTTIKPKTEVTTKPSPKKPTENKKKPEKVYERVDISETKEKNSGQSDKKVVTIPPMLKVTTDVAVGTTDATGTEGATTESVETTTKKKKSSTKKRKKNKNKRKKPSKSGSDLELKEAVKNPKQPVGAQLYNFLSREIMPTVGLGLVGVLVTAGLAGLLGYNPFVGGSIPVRRTYESHHGYSPNKYYTYNNEYSDHDSGQSEEVLFREVLSGMPEDTRYDMTKSETSYPEAQLYNSQEQAYDSQKTTVDASYPYPSGYSAYGAGGTVEDTKQYPVYTGTVGTSYVFAEQDKANVATGGETAHSPEPDLVKHSSKYSKTDTMERMPEALYRVASEGGNQYSGEESTVEGTSDQNWHRIGSPMDVRHLPNLEPGPRSLDIKKRQKRVANADSENEIDSDGSHEEASSSSEASTASGLTTWTDVPDTTTAETSTVTTESKEMTTGMQFETTTESATFRPSTTTTAAAEGGKNGTAALTEAAENEAGGGFSFLDILRRIAQLKFRLGINFLRSTTEAFTKYLEDVQKNVDESIANNTFKNPFRRKGEEGQLQRSLRSLFVKNDDTVRKTKYNNKYSKSEGEMKNRASSKKYKTKGN